MLFFCVYMKHLLYLFLLVPVLLLAGCVSTGNSENQLTAQLGDVVKVDYIGSLQDGTVFDTSLQVEAERAGLPPRPSYEPLEFTVGAGQMIPGFDNGVVGMKIGEEKIVTIPPEEAYGERSGEKVQEIPRANIQGELQVGSIISAPGVQGRVLEVNDEVVKVDFNHELAGKTLVFKITLRDITKAILE